MTAPAELRGHGGGRGALSRANCSSRRHSRPSTPIHQALRVAHCRCCWRRYTERSVKGDYVVNAALWLRREAGDSACDMVIWVEPVTTFKEGS